MNTFSKTAFIYIWYEKENNFEIFTELEAILNFSGVTFIKTFVIKICEIRL